MRREPRFAGLRRLFALPRSTRTVQREIDDEIRFHIESRTADLVAQGAPRAEAEAQALREYGDIAASRRELNQLEQRRLARERWLMRVHSLRQDTAYGIRTLSRQPAFTVSVIAVLALGIGANATMFAVLDQLLLRPPALVADPARVVTADFIRSFDGTPTHQETLSYPQYLDLAGVIGVFTSVATYVEAELAIGHGAEARAASGMRVSASYFTMLGVRAQLGRLFVAADDGDPIAPNVAVVSYGFWQRHFGGDEHVVGKELQLGNAKYVVIGVAPRHFKGLSTAAVDLWIPLTSAETPQRVAGWLRGRDGYWLRVAARLDAGVSRERAAAIASRALRSNMLRDGVGRDVMARTQPRFGFVSVLPREARVHDADAKVALLLSVVSLLVLVIACANVANLQLARGIRRRREMAVRSALGAGVGRLVQQLLCEGALLAFCAGIASVVVIWAGGLLIRGVVFPQFDWQDVRFVDTRVLSYAALVTLTAALVAGVVPALQARRAHLTSALKEGARDGRIHRSRLRSALLIVQAALSIVMLVGTGLFVRSLRHVQNLPIGMEPDRVLMAQLNLSGMAYTKAEVDNLYRRLEAAALTYPRIESAAITGSLPFWSSWGTRVHVPGRDSLPRVADGGPYFNGVTPGYLRTMGMRLLRGRDFTLADQNESSRVMIVNQAFARLAWPNEDAIGRCVRLGADTAPCAEVVGIVANPRRQEIIEDVSLQLFLPLSQTPTWADTRTLVIRPVGDARKAVEPIRRFLQSSAADLPYLSVRPMSDLVDPQKRSWRMGASVFAAFGLVAMLLAMIGLYSLLSYDVAQRSHELGVRLALGARHGDLASLVMGAGARIVAVGAGIGLGIVLLAGRMIEPLLFQTSPRQPEVLVGAIGVMLLVTLLATILPTRRALSVDPIVALKTD